ncbi:hypothetical protein [Acaryochloris thomasi]|uniref:hypothetical protein n=1 Tax=Acaryochloris thomasi TaxID=2929456 RepID=UPI000DA6C85D|nr:hypothetical protein [Acaryochloris thomasi]
MTRQNDTCGDLSEVPGQRLTQFLHEHGGREIIQKYGLFHSSETISVEVSCNGDSLGKAACCLGEVQDNFNSSEFDRSKFQEDFVGRFNELEAALPENGIEAHLTSQGIAQEDLELDFSLKSGDGLIQVKAVCRICPWWPGKGPKWCC